MRGTGTCRAASTGFSPAADILKATPLRTAFVKRSKPKADQQRSTQFRYIPTE